MRGVDSFFAVKEQTDLFTPRALTDLVAGDYLAYNSEGMSGRQTIITAPTIRRRAMRKRADSALGTVDATGSVEFTASNVSLDKLLPLAFHSKVGTADTLVFDTDGTTVLSEGATYTLVDGGYLTPFTTFVGLNGQEGAYTRRFTGCKVNRISFSARVDALLMLNVDVAAIDKNILREISTPVYPGGSVEYGYVFSDASVVLRGGDMAAYAELPVENFDLQVNHNLDTTKYRLGSYFRRSLNEGVTEVTGSFTLDSGARSLNSTTLDLTGGTTHDPAFMEVVARESQFASLKFTVIDLTREISAGVPASLEIELPAVRLEEPDFNIRDAGTITGSARFTGYDNITVVHKATLT